MSPTFLSMIGVAALFAVAIGQSAKEIREPAPVVPLADEPAPRIVVHPPLPGPLSQGLLVIQYQIENLRVVPVFGPAAVNVSPRIGHLHVTVDDLPWHWVDASGEPLVIQYLPAGPHKVLIELANANHKVLDSGAVQFVIPEKHPHDSHP